MNNTSGSLKKISKKEIKVLPIWLGHRLSDNSDYGAFDLALDYLKFHVGYHFTLFNAEEIKDNTQYLESLEINIKKVLIQQNTGPIVIFIITTANIAEDSWIDHLLLELKNFCDQNGRGDITFFYKIIMGGNFSPYPLYEKENIFSPYERRSHELSGVYSYFNCDAPSNGCHRLVELMNRILGADLPGDEFPDYEPEDLEKIAWNINRENFNSLNVREGSIPKYPIGADGRPEFPF